MKRKRRGAYYTPPALADSVAKYALSFFKDRKHTSILEPSCGDGVFIRSINKVFKRRGGKKATISAVDIEKVAIRSSKEIPLEKNLKVSFTKDDYLSFYLKDKKKRYDLIIGNPPYVIRKRLSKESISNNTRTYTTAGIDPKHFKNTWGSFLIASVLSLKENGVLAYILPAEFLQVNFAKEIRGFLQKQFERIEIITFKKVVFEGIGQDALIIFCYKQAEKKGVYFLEASDLKDLNLRGARFKEKKFNNESKIKWTSHALTRAEVNLLDEIQAQFDPVSHYCNAAAGIVTAANDFFIVDKEILKEYKLKSFATPIIQKGSFVNGGVIFSDEDLRFLQEQGKPCYLVDFTKKKKDSYSDEVKKYINLGRSLSIHERYKCVRRDPWYSIPGIWSTEGFFFKRSHLYPKILANSANIMVTDSAYRIKMKDGFNINSLIYSFYNSLTLALAELQGRTYGGGVLELTPNEFKSLPIPYVDIGKRDFNVFAGAFESKADISDILKSSDKEILRELYNFDQVTIKDLQAIRSKLVNRRLVKSQSVELDGKSAHLMP